MKFYAVKKGRTTGILTSWDDCKRSVIGFKGAEYKSFTDKKAAEEFLLGSVSERCEEFSEGVTAYVDGSYNIKTKVFSCGVVILNNGEETLMNESYDDTELALMRNVAGEIKGSMKAMEYCVANGIKTLHLFYDYEGIEKWCTGSWKTNKQGTMDYKAYYERIKPILTVYFHKVKGHSGDKYNDMADSLAKEAAGISE